MTEADDLDAFYRAVPVPILLLDGAFRIRRANPAAEALLADPLRPLIGRNFEELVVPGRAAEARRWLAALPPRPGPGTGLVVEVVDGRRSIVPVELIGSGWDSGATRSFGILLRSVSTTAPAHRATAAPSLPQLLMAERLKELV